MFQAVLFDLDGVITETSEYHYQAWKMLASGLGIKLNRAVNEQLKGVSREDSLKIILRYGGRENDFSESEFQALAAKKNNYYVESIQNVSPKDLFPGIAALLEELQTHQIKIALASASKNGSFLIERLGIKDYFDAIADPSQVEHGKPAPDIFLAAASKIGVSPDKCIGVEDAAAGIAAIKAAGMLPVGVGSPNVLGEDIAIVTTTAALTFNYLKKVWSE
ncbi:MAG: beta-phosphoglucomutase [Streptococcaceae bacterium]|jgi:beta-phosphoglucomutase|nr:beta-phosphoglucomutase [Streptococcaceae bacterium]